MSACDVVVPADPLMRPRILVTVPVEHLEATRGILESAGQVLYRRYPSREELLRDLPGTHALYPNARTSLDSSLLARAPTLVAISTPSIGTDHIDLDYCRSRGIAVYSLGTERELMRTIPSTAEHTFGLILSVMRKLPWSFRSVLDGKWSAAEFRGRDLQGKTLGIVGFGVIGSQLGSFARAFGMKVLVYDPFVVEFPDWGRGVDRDTLLRESHVVSLHLPLMPETERMVDAEWFERMQGAVLINAARGGIVDDVALITALESGRVAAAGLDVLSGETPLGMGDHPLVQYARTHDNVLITPHSAGSSVESQIKSFAHAARRLADHLQQNPIQ